MSRSTPSPRAVTACFLAAAVLLAPCGCARKGKERDASADASALGRHKVRLSIFAGQSTPDPGIEEMIDELLEKERPGLELEWESVGWGDKFQSQLQAKFAAGEVPDIIIGKAQDVATCTPSGNIAPASPGLLKYVREEALPSVSSGGLAYGIPYNAFYQGVFYNKDVFERLGLSVPRTRAELDALVGRLRAAGVTPFAAAFGENWYVGNVMMQLAMGEIFERDPAWGDRFRAGKASFSDSPEMRRCARGLRYLRDSSWPDTLTLGASECDERFAAGKAAMYVTGTWTLQTINAVRPSMRVGLFPFPASSGGSRLIFEPNMTFMKSSRTAHPDEVDEVLSAVFSSRELASEILGFTRTSPLLKDAGPAIDLPVQADIDRYSREGRVVDVTVGNTQLIWSFQEEVAADLTRWLQGKESLAEVLASADRNRPLSGPR
jgi:ABC-type glycerol-3-phosphate transport system substrate-binding protein